MRQTYRFAFFTPLLVLAAILPGALAQELPVPSPPTIGAKSYLAIDGNSGYELAALLPDETLPPASLTKLMSAYA
ncbi:MAG TPA: serine-type D-Ala-D-Ala carboxypeptidase, partial [Woeseiaceae bacterium]